MTRARAALALAAALALLAALPYLAGGVSRNFIVVDDGQYIYENPQVRRGLNAQTALWALTTTEHANWYPLRRLSHLVDVSLFGLDARGHHLVSVAWHAAAATALFFALRLLTGALWRSFVVAALFAVHPLQVESVAWAAERSNVLAGFFFALTLLLWARYARRPGTGTYLAALASCALGLMSKPVLVTLPFVLLLLDFWPLGRLSGPGAPPWRVSPARLGRRLLEQAPLLLLAAGPGAVALFAHQQTDSLSSLEALPLGIRLGNAALSYARYAGSLFWPADLAMFYPHPGANLHRGAAAAAALLLAAATALALALTRRSPWLAVGWLWFLGMLVPTSGIVQFGAHAMADRFAYLPSVGFFLALVWLAAQAPLPARLLPALPAALAAAALAALTVASALQAGYWRDNETLFRRTVAVTRDNYLFHNNLARVLAEEGRHAEAIASAREALRIQPRHAEAHYNLGSSLAALGRHEEAVGSYREALHIRADYQKAQFNLAVSLAKLGRKEAAVAGFREALRLQVDLPEAWYSLGVVLADLGRTGEAAASLREALRLRPDYAAARAGLRVIEQRGPR